MKKSLFLVWVFLLVFIGNCFASDNPFDDVPQNNWAYDAVNKLAKDGLITGYNGSLKGDQTITRYEMAVIVAKALSKEQNANEQNKNLIQKLSQEFSGELKTLGAKVSFLENQVNKWDMVGTVALKYSVHSSNDPMVSPDGGGTKLDTWINCNMLTQYHIGEWSANIEATFLRNLTNPYDRPNGVVSPVLGEIGMDEKLFVTGPIAKVKTTFGVYNYTSAYGLIYDNQAENNKIDGLAGVQFAFGNTVKTSINIGKIEHNIGIQNRYPWGPLMNDSYFDSSRIDSEKLKIYSANGSDPRYFGIDIAAPLSRTANVKAAYQRVYSASGSDGEPYSGVNYYEAGFDTKIGQDYMFKAVFGKSSFTRENNTYLIGLNYKGTGDNTTVGVYGMWVKYIKSEANATIDGGYDIQDKVNGAKGWEVGFDYVPYRQILVSTKYLDVKGTANRSFGNRVFLTQVDFFF